jgi:outer membrane usher protein
VTPLARTGAPIRRATRTAFCGAALLLVLAMPASVLAQSQRAFLSLVLNGVSKGDALVLLQGEDVLIGVSVLETAGLAEIGGTRTRSDNEEFVSLASLAPDVTFAVDERALTLEITAKPERLGRKVIDFRRDGGEGFAYRSSPAAYVNYALTAGSGSLEVFTESVFSARGAVLYSTLSTRPGGATRGLTNLTFDQKNALRRWTLGDGFSSASGLGGDAVVAGISVAREFSLAPYFVRQPMLSVTTPVATPSTLEVYVNGRLVRQERVEPGRVDLRNLPLSSGHNDTRVIVRDPFGGVNEISSGFYMTSTALARGVHDYHYLAGWRRDGLGDSSWGYGPPVVMGRHRRGFTDTLTLGGRFEAERGVTGGGASLNVRLPVGELEAEAATSAGERWATAGRASYLFSGPRMSLGLSAMRAQDGYQTVGHDLRQPRPTLDIGAFGSIALGRGATATFQHSTSRNTDDTRRQQTSLTASTRVMRYVELVTSVARISAEHHDLQVSVGLTIALGGRNMAAVSAVRDRTGTHSVVETQRSLPAGTGMGYQVRADQAGAGTISGALQYQGKYGRYELRRDMTAGQDGSTVSVSGAVTMIGGGLYASRAIRNSFALVKVPGVDNVRTYASNQEIGRTNRAGNVLVPDLLPFYGNQLSIADTDIPLDYVVPSVRTAIAPPYRGGAVVQFPVTRVQRTVGTIRIVGLDGEALSRFGEMRVTAPGQTYESPIGSDGQFYFENVPAGRHHAVVTYPDGSCTATVVVPESQELVLQLGLLTCRAALEGGEQ